MSDFYPSIAVSFTSILTIWFITSTFEKLYLHLINDLLSCAILLTMSSVPLNSFLCIFRIVAGAVCTVLPVLPRDVPLVSDWALPPETRCKQILSFRRRWRRLASISFCNLVSLNCPAICINICAQGHAIRYRDSKLSDICSKLSSAFVFLENDFLKFNCGVPF